MSSTSLSSSIRRLLLHPRQPNMLLLVLSVLFIGILLTAMNIYQLRAMQHEHYQSSSHHTMSPHIAPSNRHRSADHDQRPIVWIAGRNNVRGGHLAHVFDVFERLGFATVDERNDNEKWHILWHHDYPFGNNQLNKQLQKLESHQRVNHIPGSGYYTSKVSLATSNISGIPPAFNLPDRKDEFVKFANAHPDKFWVQKNNNHRNIRIKKIDELNLNQEQSFAQEYVSKPLLIDKRKFDIGIYTVVTSIRPLRVYIYEGDVLVRFCPKDYHPFDPNIVDKYVVGDDYTPVWEMPSLSKYYTDMKYTFREALNAHVRSIGKDPERIWTQIRNTIREVFQSQQSSMVPMTMNYVHSANFFELSRFDFVLDDDLNVYLMEANMSPNLSSSHFVENQLLYEQVLMNLFSLVGIATHIHGKQSSSLRSSDAIAQMLVSDRDIQVYSDRCASQECQDTCAQSICKLCHKCMNDQQIDMYRRAYNEHISRRNMRRVLPIVNEHTKEKSKFEPIEGGDDHLLSLWVAGQCLKDVTWCN